jgi:hypothetical protein
VPATSRSAFRRPQELDRRGTGEGDRVAAQLVDDRRALATKPPYVGRRVLPERGVVAGPVMEVGRLRSRVSKHSSEGCDRRALISSSGEETGVDDNQRSALRGGEAPRVATNPPRGSLKRFVHSSALDIAP